MTDATATDAAKGSSSPGRNLATAIIIGLVLAGGFIWSLTLGATAITVLVAAFMVLGLVESAAQLRSHGIHPVVPVLVATAIVTPAATLRVGHVGMVIGVVTLLFGSALWLLLERRRHDAIRRVSTTLLLGLWLGFLGSFAVVLAVVDDGPWLLFLVVATTAFADVGAYAVGSLIGSHKLAPSLSPNKSWEGFIGGLALAALAGWGLVAWAYPALGASLDLTGARGAVVGLACAVAGFGGDLFESLVKRELGIKDFGSLLPGHGGVLDRVDGILTALPVGWLLLVAW